MKILLQRVSEASVSVDDQMIGQIGKGLLLFVGITHGDSEEDVEYLTDKVLGMRVYENEEGKPFDKNIVDISGEILVVSQFTLYARTDKGRRPDFGDAAKPDVAKRLYEEFVALMKVKSGLKVETGQFQAHMLVNLVNDGPVTLEIVSKG